MNRKPIDPAAAYEIGAKVMKLFSKYEMTMAERMHLLYMLIGMTIINYTSGNEDLFKDGVQYAAAELRLMRLVQTKDGPGLWIDTPGEEPPTLN